MSASFFLSMKKLLMLFFGMLLFSCAGSQEDALVKPENLIEKEKMIEVLADFRLVEGTVRQMAGYGKDTKELAKYYYDKVFEKHQITLEQFQQNMEYYSQQPEVMYEISSEVVNRLTEMYTDVSTRK